ncbi:MAG: SRPBCC family protein [Acidimicrobiales bacterium]
MPKLSPQPPEWIHSAPFQTSASRVLPARPDRVFEALADHESWPEWFDAISEVERYGETPEGVGSNRRVFLNKRVSIDEEFNVWEPGERWGFVVLRTTLPGLDSMSELVTIEDLGDGSSSVTYKMGIDAKFPLSFLLKRAVGPMAKNLGAALDNLGRKLGRGSDPSVPPS